MDKIWYIIIDGATLGPFTELELRRRDGITPDTLCWREGFAGWMAMRDVPELKKVFEDDEPLETSEELEGEEGEKSPDGELALAVKDPNYVFWWLVIAALILSYILSKLF
ncbi:MAG: DUF4339 domain-containing protein [Parachlamydiaceae bacterium]